MNRSSNRKTSHRYLVLALQVVLFLVCFDPLLKSDSGVVSHGTFCSADTVSTSADSLFSHSEENHEPVILSKADHSRLSRLSHNSRHLLYVWFKAVPLWIPGTAPATHTDSLVEGITALQRKSGVYIAKMIPKYPSF